MPALASKPTVESNQDYHIAAARGAGSAPGQRAGVKRRWHESPPAGSTPERAGRNKSDEDWRELVEHFGGAQPSSVVAEKAEVEARREARRKARRRHRPFRMTLIASALVGAPLILLACLLWMKSNALSLSRQDAVLQSQIEAARFELQSTRREIAAVNASPQVEQWAKERGWHQATQQDFDDVSKVATPTTNPAQIEGNNAP
jgi:hypothetical protein